MQMPHSHLLGVPPHPNYKVFLLLLIAQAAAVKGTLEGLELQVAARLSLYLNHSNQVQRSPLNKGTQIA